MNPLSPESARIEEIRIQEVYAKRKGNDTRYSWFNPGHLFIVQELERQLLGLLLRYGCATLDTKKILEIGCGTGYWLREFIKWGARPENIAGVDLLPDYIDEARHASPGSMRLQCASATRLEFPDATFDLVLQFTVFTSVLDPDMRRQIASEMLRVLKPDGFILWYDFRVNNPSNHDVRGVNKKEISRLFPHSRIELKRVTLTPPLTRLLVPLSWTACYFLERLRILNTHYLGVISKS